jgi:hypothetical protein
MYKHMKKATKTSDSNLFSNSKSYHYSWLMHAIFNIVVEGGS